jgi:hypothetical protein
MSHGIVRGSQYVPGEVVTGCLACTLGLASGCLLFLELRVYPNDAMRQAPVWIAVQTFPTFVKVELSCGLPRLRFAPQREAIWVRRIVGRSLAGADQIVRLIASRDSRSSHFALKVQVQIWLYLCHAYRRMITRNRMSPCNLQSIELIHTGSTRSGMKGIIRSSLALPKYHPLCNWLLAWICCSKQMQYQSGWVHVLIGGDCFVCNIVEVAEIPVERCFKNSVSRLFWYCNWRLIFGFLPIR